MSDRSVDVQAAHAALRAQIARHDGALVAFSAGIDSTLVLAVAVEVLGHRAAAVIGVSPSVPEAELHEARALAGHLGAELVERPTHELDDPDYVANGRDRCRYCKTELYQVASAVAAERGAVVMDGTQADDLGDDRPGLQAGERAGVVTPLADAGLGKHAVRELARHLGLPNWDKPAMACLASRIPHGTAVTADRLAAVDGVERALRAMGFAQVRARHLDDTVRLEVEPERVAELTLRASEPELTRAVAAAGFRRAVVHPEGYVTGSLHRETARTAPSPAPRGSR